MAGAERVQRLWCFNLSAELELSHGADFTAKAKKQSEAAIAQLRSSLPDGDRVIDTPPPRAEARDFEGHAWCPTPRARRLLAATGCWLPEAPELKVLRAVNSRIFHAQRDTWSDELATLPDTSAHFDADDLIARLDAPGPTGEWLLKREFTWAGRGHRRIGGGNRTPADLKWIEASLKRGPLFLEPRVQISVECGIHAQLKQSGEVLKGTVTVQSVDSHGCFRGCRTHRPGELSNSELAAIDLALSTVATDLHTKGYFGPFGIDCFRYELAGKESFQAISEINARYSMGHAISMGGL